jgi:hypothetical protein
MPPKLSPSTASSWLNCPGAVYSKKRDSTIDQIDGIFAHCILEYSILKNTLPIDIIINSVDLDNEVFDQLKYIYNKEKNPEILERIDALFTFKESVISEFINYINPLYERIKGLENGGWIIESEKQINLRAYLGHNFTNGYIDVSGFKDNACMVIDLKYGFRMVSAKNNYQLMIYCVGLMMEFIERKGYPPERFIMIIAQPRIKGNEWDQEIITLSTIDKFIDILVNRGILVLEHINGVNHVKEPSVAACKYCDLSIDCKERYDLALEKIENINGFNKSISNDKLSTILNDIPFINTIIRDAETLAKKRVLRGEHIKGRKVLCGVKRKKWKFKDDKIIRYAKMLGLGSIMSSKVKSPSAVLDGGLSVDKKEIVKSMIEVNEGEPRLALSNDKRKSTLENVAGQFNKLKPKGDKSVK